MKNFIMKKVYITIGLHKNAAPEIIGVFKTKQDAAKTAYTAENTEKYSFVNIIEKPIQGG